MLYRVLRFSAVFVAFPALAVLTFGQALQSPVRISLEQAIQLALAHNHALLAARTTITQSKDEEITANLRPNPVFGADVVGLPEEPSDFTAANIDQTEFDIGVGYLFERGKKRQHRLRAAQDATAVTTSTVADNERTLTSNVATAFISVLLAESTLDFAKQDLASFQNTINISQAQYKAGAISEGDFLKIKLQLLQFQTDVTAADLAKQQSLVALRQLLGFESVPENYDVAGSLAYQKMPYGLEDLQAMAIKDRPDLRAAEQGVTAARSQYLLAKAEGKVDVNGTLNETHITGYNSASVIVSMPLPIFNRNQGEIARTNAAISQAQELQQEASEQVMSDVQSAFESLHTDEQTLQIYQSGYLDQAKQSVDISQYAYKRGAASLLDFLDAERSYRSIQLAYRQELATYMLSLEQLREAVGTRNLP
ncbi:MAG TPA: TolC family protein [Candidatus Acidoferrales bacterium]|nr:TolC family protein [Candidatus Acidoferrales bacterium]